MRIPGEIAVVIFIFGTIVGSFLNVCIYRIPAGLSVVHPGSRCPACETPIFWYQNIPIFSWIFLGGRCAHCRVIISPRYPLIEALNGLLWLAVFFHYGLTMSSLVYSAFLSTLLVITWIDIDHQVIPNVISVPAILIGFICAVFILPIHWVSSLIGVVFGGGFLLAVAVGYRFLTGVDGMGMGDVKLLAMIGAFLGWEAILPTLFLGSLAGTVVGIPLMIYQKAGRRFALPFGPFLSLGAVLYLFIWPQLSAWYFSNFLAVH